MNPIYLDTRFKRDGENDPTFNELESIPIEFAIITAYATTGEHWSDAANNEADKQLKTYLDSQFSCVVSWRLYKKKVTDVASII